MQDTMNEEKPDFAAQRMANDPGLESRLLEIDGDVAGQGRGPRAGA